MKTTLILIILFLVSTISINSQIDALDSPYYQYGMNSVVVDSNMTDVSVPLLFFHPETPGNYPVFMFQLGANGFGSSVINRHTYDLFMEHLASYGFTIIVIDDSQAGLPNGASFLEAHDWFTAHVIDQNHWLSNFADPNFFVVGGHSNGGVNASALLVDRPAEIDGIVFMDSYPSTGVFGIGAHDVSGYTGKELTLTADENNPDASKDGYMSFTNTTCKTFVNITGLDHGGFGDYVLASQPVGSIGREQATATIRHFLVSWMLSEFSGNAVASDNLANTALHPITVSEFLNDCSTLSTAALENDAMLNEQVYPNPFNGEIRIENISQDVNIAIYNTVGSLVYQDENFAKNTTINLNGLIAGMYYLYITDSNGNVLITKKMVKK